MSRHFEQRLTGVKWRRGWVSSHRLNKTNTVEYSFREKGR